MTNKQISDQFIVVEASAGSGKTLFGLVKKINKDVIPLNVEDKDSLRETLRVLKENIKC